MIQSIACVLRDKRGNSAVELAMVMPLVLMMALGGIDFAMGFRHKIQIQQHAQTGAEYVMGTMESLPAAIDVRKAVSDASGLPLGSVNADVWIECDGVKQTVGVLICLDPGADKAKYMEITVTDEWTPMLNIEGIADFATTQTHVGSVTLRTE